MRKSMKVIICMGILAASLWNAEETMSYAEQYNENAEYESIKLIQNGAVGIPKESYNFEKEDIETLITYNTVEESDSTLAKKQEAAQAARSNDNATLEERKAACAKALYSGMVALDAQIDVAQFALTTDEFREVISDVVNSNPELFYIRNGYKRKTFVLSDTDDTNIVDYCYGFYEYQTTIEGQQIPEPQTDIIYNLITQVEAKRDQILSDVIVSGMSSMEKALMIHEYLVLNTQYNYTAYLQYEKDGSTSHFSDSDYDIYGTLVKGQAVCQGYTLSYKYLLEAAGVENVGFASGKNHIWNTVTLNGAGYYVDCTWDDTNWDTLGNVKHNYFLKNEENLKNHTIVETDRNCTGTTYANMFWSNVDSGIFYYRGLYYYMAEDGSLCKIKLRTLSDIAEGVQQVFNPGLTETDSWNYDNGAKITVAGSNVIYHSSGEISFYNLKTGESGSICKPELEENELIYGLLYQDGIFQYATKKQKIEEEKVTYNNTEQKIYTYSLPKTLFDISVDSVTVSGTKTIRLTMQDGEYISEFVTLKANILPENATDKRIYKWTSSDSSIAVVDINGKVKGLKPGTVTITAITNDGRKEGTFQLEVILDGPIADEDGVAVYYEEGKKITNQFYTIDGTSYYIGNDGKKVSGWYKINGQQYYFKEAGIYVTGWQTIDGKRYYFDKNGVMLTGWQKISKKQYYFSSNGVMTTGWKTIKKKKYYFDKKGVMTTGWKTIKKKKYYFSKKGVMTTGWKTIKKKKYYFDKKGVMPTGWKTIKKKKYYFNKKGVMQKGLKQINGVYYYFAKDGHLVG